MELHYYNFFVYVGGDSSEYPRARRHTTDEYLAQVYPQDIVFLWEQGADVHIRAACTGIHSGLGDTTAFDGKEDSKGEWYVVLVRISLAL
jgi:hypothetical protein